MVNVQASGREQAESGRASHRGGLGLVASLFGERSGFWAETGPNGEYRTEVTRRGGIGRLVRVAAMRWFRPVPSEIGSRCDRHCGEPLASFPGR
jgi:hypothetical protein